MDRRAFVAALGGVFAVTAAKAQSTGVPIIGDIFNAGGNIATAGVSAGGNIAAAGVNAGTNVIGAGLGAGSNLLDVPTGITDTVLGGDFRMQDLQGGAYTSAASNLALQRSRSRAIRDFAMLEIAEQQSIAQQLFSQPGAVPPRPDQLAVLEGLSRTSGRRFDHRYVVGEIYAHQAALKLNTFYATNGIDPRAKSVARLSIPTIQSHLAILSRLAAGIPAV